jgi:hypothetical protein
MRMFHRVSFWVTVELQNPQMTRNLQPPTRAENVAVPQDDCVHGMVA